MEWLRRFATASVAEGRADDRTGLPADGAVSKTEIFGLTSQMRRASVSVQTQLVISSRLAFGTTDLLLEAEQCSFQVGRFLVSTIKGLHKKVSR